MLDILSIFKAVSLIFASLAVITGLQGLFTPVSFAASFGMPIESRDKPADDTAKAYVALMGVRQLATGITLFAFAWQGRWTEMATLLAVLGVIVACTDGAFLARRRLGLGIFHALPGLLISVLSLATLALNAVQ